MNVQELDILSDDPRARAARKRIRNLSRLCHQLPPRHLARRLYVSLIVGVLAGWRYDNRRAA